MTPDERDEKEWAQRIAESRALIAKLEAETLYIQRQRMFYPVVICSGAALAVTAVVKLFL